MHSNNAFVISSISAFRASMSGSLSCLTKKYFCGRMSLEFSEPYYIFRGIGNQYPTLTDGCPTLSSERDKICGLIN